MGGVFYCRIHEAQHLQITDEAETLNLARLGHGITPDGSGCWLWLGSRNDGGYGTFVPEGANTAQWLTHRVAWNLLQGGHKPGLELDHRTCKRRNCVNPIHLEPVTSGVNQRRKRRGPDQGWINPDAASNDRVTEFAERHGLPLANGKRQHHLHRQASPAGHALPTRKGPYAPTDHCRNLPHERVGPNESPVP